MWYGSQINYLLKEAHRWTLVLALFTFHPHNVFILLTLSSSLHAYLQTVSSTGILYESLEEYSTLINLATRPIRFFFPVLVCNLWHAASLYSGYYGTLNYNYLN